MIICIFIRISKLLFFVVFKRNWTNVLFYEHKSIFNYVKLKKTITSTTLTVVLTVS